MTFPTRLQAAAIAVTTLVLGSLTAPAVAGTMATDQHNFIHVEMGATTPEARSVGLFTLARDDSLSVTRGSGVLVGGRYVLTAAHLVDDIAGGTFTISGKTYGINRLVVANRFYGRSPETGNPQDRLFGNGADLALVELDRRVVGARNLKATISRSRKEPGKTATIVGFGTAGNGATGSFTPPLPSDSSDVDFSADNPPVVPGSSVWSFQPVKRAGKNVVEPITPFSGNVVNSQRELTIDFDPDPNQINALSATLTVPQTLIDPFTGEFTIDEDDIPMTGEYMPATGDSGGGLFINGKLAGITSWTTREGSTFFSQAQFTRLSAGWWKWVRDNIRAFNDVRRNGLALRPWNRVDNSGNGFRGVAKILVEADDEDAGLVEGQVLNIFGPGLLRNETGDEITIDGNLYPFVISNDFAATPAPLPEPTSLALLGLGGLAALRRSRR